MRIGTEKAKRKTKEETRKVSPTEEEDLAEVYCPPSPVCDPTSKQDPLPCYIPKEKLALDSNYYPKGYIPKEEETPLLVNNLINPLEKNTPEDP